MHAMTSNTIPFSADSTWRQAALDAACPRVMVAGGTGKTTTAHWLRAALRLLKPNHAIVRRDVNASSGESEQTGYRVEECHCDARIAMTSEAVGQADVVVVAQGFGAGTSQGEAHQADALEKLIERLTPGGRLIVNGDEPALRRFAAGPQRHQVLQVGRGSHCDLVASEVRFHDGWLTMSVDGQSLTVPAWGRHHLHSVLAAYTTGRLLDLSHADVVTSLRHFRPAVGACQVVRTPALTLVADRPDGRVTAMSAALDVLRELSVRGRRVVLCGSNRFEERPNHSAWAQYGERIVSRCGADLAIGVGEAGATMVAAARLAGMSTTRAIACDTADEVMDRLRPWLRSGDAILITARDEQELDAWIQSLVPLTDAVAA